MSDTSSNLPDKKKPIILSSLRIEDGSIPWIDTHFYDGKLDRSKVLNGKYSDDDLIKTCREILSFIAIENTICLNTKKRVMSSISLIMKDLRGNYDKTDDIQVRDLLVPIWILLGKKDKIPKYIWEQIGDILNGTCPQGRVKRLYQIWISL